jgi:hypothetical protein
MATAEEQAAEALHSITLNSIHTYPGRFEWNSRPRGDSFITIFSQKLTPRLRIFLSLETSFSFHTNVFKIKI